MAEPELLVDQRQRLADRGALVVRDADIGQDEELEHHVLVAPDRADLIFGPAAAMARDDLVLRDMLEGPFMRLEISGEHVDRLGFLLAGGISSRSIMAGNHKLACLRGRIAP